MSDRIVVMNEGRVEQIGTPFEIYNYPRSRVRRLLRRHPQHHAGADRRPGRRHGRASTARRSSAKGRRRRQAGRGAPGRAAARGDLARRRRRMAATSMTGTIEEVSFLGAVVRIRVRFGESADARSTPSTIPGSRRRLAAPTRRSASAATTSWFWRRPRSTKCRRSVPGSDRRQVGGNIGATRRFEAAFSNSPPSSSRSRSGERLSPRARLSGFVARSMDRNDRRIRRGAGARSSSET